MSKIKITDHSQISNDSMNSFKSKDLLDRSEAIQEIISKRPGFVEKWSVFIFVGLLLLLSLCTWFIEYPDIIEVKGKLVASNKPISIIQHGAGRIMNLFVKNDQPVKQGDIIGLFNCNRDVLEVWNLNVQLDSCIAYLSQRRFNDIAILFNTPKTNLGVLQNQYNNLVYSVHWISKNTEIEVIEKRDMDTLKKKSGSKDDNSIIEKIQGPKRKNSQDHKNLIAKTNRKELNFENDSILRAYRAEQVNMIENGIPFPKLNGTGTIDQNLQKNKIYKQDSVEEHKVRQSKHFEGDISSPNIIGKNGSRQMKLSNDSAFRAYQAEQVKMIEEGIPIPAINEKSSSIQKLRKPNEGLLTPINRNKERQMAVFEETVLSLKQNVVLWLDQYIIRSPIDGTIYYALPVHEMMDVEQGKLLGYIYPSNNKYYVEMFLPQNNSGKIDTGMQVQLRFNSFPYQEFGFVSGRLDFISKIGSDSGFLATIRLDNSLKTNLNNIIQYREGLKADALIITKNMRLFNRIYASIKGPLSGLR